MKKKNSNYFIYFMKFNRIMTLKWNGFFFGINVTPDKQKLSGEKHLIHIV